MTRIAILYKKDSVLVEFKPKVFRELLKTYLKSEGSIDKAMGKIEQDLKQETKYV